MPAEQPDFKQDELQSAGGPDVADVVIDADAPDLQPAYTYSVPAQLLATTVVGSCVHVQFHGRDVLGFVTGTRRLAADDPLVSKLHSVLAVLDESASITVEQIALARWMGRQYVCDLITAIKCVAPAALGGKIDTSVTLTNPDTESALITRSQRQAHIVEILLSLGGSASLAKLREASNLPDFAGAYSALISRGVITEQVNIVSAKSRVKSVAVYSLSADTGKMLLDSRLSIQQRRITELLSIRQAASLARLTAVEITAATQASALSIKGLVRKGVLAITRQTLLRSPYMGIKTGTVPPVLSPSQAAAAHQISELLLRKEHRTVLLFGVTASGKTEVYLNAIEAALALGRAAIVLVPEIALTTQLVEIFVGRFGNQVAVLHSRLSDGERHDEWRRLQQGAARIVVGARSAVFAPISNIALIVMDEEHEASYKQEKSPRYSAREVAAERARTNGAVLLLGSATPAIESYWSSRSVTGKQAGRSENSRPEALAVRIEMPQRIDERPMPYVHIVDMREEFKFRRTLFSERLATGIADRLQAGHQTILFLNRRGYSQFVLCRDCGWTAKCRNCAVALTYHIAVRSLRCHYCGYAQRTPTLCPTCSGSDVKAFGLGTEKVEEEVLRLFPTARVARMDRDTTRGKGSHGRILKRFRENEADVLVGTQMVAKGLDFPSVTLVGVVAADTSINVPDFRAAERTFQLLAQVAGRSGRGERPGEVIVQTFSPEHYAVRAAMVHDYVAFYEQEISYRHELGYPPFSRLANIVCTHKSEAEARIQAAELAKAIFAVKPSNVQVIGPSPCPIPRIKDEYRYHVALKAPVDGPLAEIVSAALKRLAREHRRGLSIDMDPLSMA